MKSHSGFNGKYHLQITMPFLLLSQLIIKELLEQPYKDQVIRLPTMARVRGIEKLYSTRYDTK